MRELVGGLNLILGFVYIQYGTLTIVDMRRNWKTMGFSHFGMAWIAMAFTCGPHHFVHGLHLLLSTGTAPGPLDWIAVAVGFPAGVTWFLLRVEAFTGGRGDRFVKGNPVWVMAIPTLFGIYVTAVVAAVLVHGISNPTELALVAPNLLLVVIYCLIGYYLTRTQIANRTPIGGWSLSGLALAVIFPTCAAMHAVYAFYAVTGRYGIMSAGMGIDWFAVPAGLYFLWVVQALYKGTYLDWNSARALYDEVPAT
jgi:hypothetical protein